MTRFCSVLAHAFRLLFLNWKCLLFVRPYSDNDCLGLEENFSHLFPYVTNLLFRALVNRFPIRSPGNSVFVRRLFPYPPREETILSLSDQSPARESAKVLVLLILCSVKQKRQKDENNENDPKRKVELWHCPSRIMSTRSLIWRLLACLFD